MRFTSHLIGSIALALLFVLGGVASSAADDGKLAMKGYDPVSYFVEGHPANGKPEYSHVWDGERYQFASAAHRDLFAANPEKYAPQFPGYCAASLTRGEVVTPDPEHWIIVDGKLYLFGKEFGPRLFRENPGLVAKAEAHWAQMHKEKK